MVALDATMVVKSIDGERSVPASKFFAGPATHITRMTSLEPGEILAAVRLPSKWAGKRFYFEKVADRNVWDFALVSIAVAMDISDNVISDCRVVCGGVAAVPYRLSNVERAAKGESLGDTVGDKLAPLAAQGARPLNYNHFKMPLMENLVRRAMRG
jgi:xanthine dehydrogenase YagS FAD-binding subunit